MVINIEVYKDDFLIQKELRVRAAQMINRGVKAKIAYTRAAKRVSKIQYMQTINTDPKYDKDINPVKIAQDIVGKKRFKVTTSKA